MRYFGRSVAGKAVSSTAAIGSIAGGFYNWWVIGNATEMQ